MKINYYAGTDEILKEIGSRIKAARVDMNITQSLLAEKTGISKRTVSNLENGKDVSFMTLIDVLRVLGLADRIDLIVPEATYRPSQIVKNMKKRERASSTSNIVSDNSWKWGDEK